MRHLRHLVDFIEDKHGIARAGLLDALDDTARHGTDIRTAVTTDLRLVVQATQRHTHILAFHSRGDALAQRGLTDTRRTVEADNRTLQVTPQSQHSHIFEDTLLHLFHTVVVLIEDFLRTLQVQVVLRVFAPRQADEGLQIVQLHVEIGTLWIQVVQFVGLLIEHLTHLIRPFLSLGLTQQFALLGCRLAIAHLRLQILDLLLEEVVTLLLVDVLTRLVADVGLQVLEVDLTVQDLHHAEQAFLHVFHLQQGHLLLHGERHVRTDEVQGHHVVGDVLHGERCLVRNILADVDILVHHAAEVFNGRLELTVFLLRLDVFQLFHDSFEIGSGLHDLIQTETT